MADTITLNAGSGGSVVATDDIGGVHYQRIKLIFGADGTNVGDVSTTNPLPIQGGNIARSSAAWTSATAQNTALTMAVTGFAAAGLTIVTTTTITAGAVTTEVSDDGGTTWFPISARITGSAVIHKSWNLSANDSKAWLIGVAAFTHVRLRLSTAISGSGTVTVALIGQALPDATNPNPGVVRAATATLTNVASSGTNVTLLAANDIRIGVIMFNDSTSNVDVKYGTTASATSFTYEVFAGAHWEMPQPVYAGQIDCIWDSANGSARVTELTG